MLGGFRVLIQLTDGRYTDKIVDAHDRAGALEVILINFFESGRCTRASAPCRLSVKLQPVSLLRATHHPESLCPASRRAVRWFSGKLDGGTASRRAVRWFSGKLDGGTASRRAVRWFSGKLDGGTASRRAVRWFSGKLDGGTASRRAVRWFSGFVVICEGGVRVTDEATSYLDTLETALFRHSIHEDTTAACSPNALQLFPDKLRVAGLVAFCRVGTLSMRGRIYVWAKHLRPVCLPG
ncbi:hypothetical protein RRG08_006833 [Elysia crispata]|uniref:Uncharacterized protein n=1 Tax=Elysia crispata TaxID=231223 RepID=A0AAE1CMX0_9GAST|nr:hypothetical protein RRG08_006833 [Elysia crispata]